MTADRPGSTDRDPRFGSSLASRRTPSATTDPLDFERLAHHADIRQAIGDVIPGYASIREIDETRREFQIGARTFHRAALRDASGARAWHVVELPSDEAAPDEIRLD